MDGWRIEPHAASVVSPAAARQRTAQERNAAPCTGAAFLFGICGPQTFAHSSATACPCGINRLGQEQFSEREVVDQRPARPRWVNQPDTFFLAIFPKRRLAQSGYFGCDLECHGQRLNVSRSQPNMVADFAAGDFGTCCHHVRSHLRSRTTMNEHTQRRNCLGFRATGFSGNWRYPRNRFSGNQGFAAIQ